MQNIKNRVILTFREFFNYLIQQVFAMDIDMKKYIAKKFFIELAAVISAALFAGCSHSQVFTEPLSANTPAPAGMQAVAYGRAQNCGYYLFNKFPLHTGHPYHPNRKDYRAWHDDVNPEVNAAMLLDSMRNLYDAETLANVEHQESSWGYFSLWIIWRKSISTTALGLKPLKAKKAKKQK